MIVLQAECIHSTPGRLRVSVPAAKGNKELMGHIQEELSRCPLAISVKANPVTGNVLILHSADAGEIARYAEAHGIFRLSYMKRQRAGIAHKTMAAYDNLDTAIRRLSGGELDLPHTAFVAFLGTGAVQILRGRFRAPPWHTAFWYALHLFLLTHANKERKR